MFPSCTSQGVVTIVKWLISLVVTSNHKCLNKVVSNKLALIIFESGTPTTKGGTCSFGTFHWWRIPCYTQDLLGWKECSVLQAK